MREILFRGKRTGNGEWWYGLPLRTLNENGEDVLNIQCWERDAEGVTGIYEPVLPDTVGQYTGLPDKNGKKIFEGDIIRVDDTEIAVVEYDETSAFYMAVFDRAESDFGSLIGQYPNVEIIGNIHDNKLEDFADGN